MPSSINLSSSNQFDFKQQLLVLGCGGHSKVVTEVAEAIGFNYITYMDTSKEEKNFFLANKLLSKSTKIIMVIFFVAIGDNYVRQKVYNQFITAHKRAKCISLIHPKSCISFRTSIGEGSIIMPLSVVNSSTTLGKCVIVNTSSSVDHDSVLMDFSSLAPGVHMGGNVSVVIRSVISIGSSIKHGVEIGNDVVVGSSSLVLDDIEDNSVAYGIPSRFIRKRKLGEQYL